MTDRAQARAQLGIGADETCVLVFGGSLGARSINVAAPEAFADAPYRVVHVAGTRDYPDLKAPGPHYVLLDYLTPFGIALAAADVAVARAGGSIFELAQYGLPTVLIPYPHASADHQTLERAVDGGRRRRARAARRRAHARAPARRDRRGARAAARRCPRRPPRSPARTRRATSHTRSSPRLRAKRFTPPGEDGRCGMRGRVAHRQQPTPPQRKNHLPNDHPLRLLGLIITAAVGFAVWRSRATTASRSPRPSGCRSGRSSSSRRPRRPPRTSARVASTPRRPPRTCRTTPLDLSNDALEAASDSNIPDAAKEQLEEAQEQLEALDTDVASPIHSSRS